MALNDVALMTSTVVICKSIAASCLSMSYLDMFEGIGVLFSGEKYYDKHKITVTYDTLYSNNKKCQSKTSDSTIHTYLKKITFGFSKVIIIEICENLLV